MDPEELSDHRTISEKPSEGTQPLDPDAVLQHAGDFHLFQYTLVGLFAVINVLSAFHYFGQTFATLQPEYRCTSWQNDTVNNSVNNGFDGNQCYRTVGEEVEEYCTKWEYKSSFGFKSIVEELNWICREDWKSALGQSIFFVGSVLASIIFGILADRIGRLHVLVLANMCAFLGNVATTFATTVEAFSFYRLVAGAATDSNFIMMYIIVMEYIRPSARTIGLNLTIGVFYCLASMAIPWIAVLTQHWTYFMLAVGVPHLIILVFYFAVPESAQWLLSTGRIDQAVACYEKIGQRNGRPIAPPILLGLREYARQHMKINIDNAEKDVHHATFLSLLRTPHLRRKTLILIFKSMVMTLGYDAIARNVNELAYSPFVVFTITSSTIFPACLVVVVLQDTIGRKALASGALLTSGVFIIIAGVILVTSDNAILTLIATVISRLAVVVAYNSGHQYAVELIPVQVRGQGVSVIHVAGFLASFFSPQILYLSIVWKAVPDLFLGILLISGALACLFLPETLNKSLPVTLAEGERFGQGEGIFENILYKRSGIGDSKTHILSASTLTVPSTLLHEETHM